jgi:hypothetical protein
VRDGVAAIVVAPRRKATGPASESGASAAALPAAAALRVASAPALAPAPVLAPALSRVASAVGDSATSLPLVSLPLTLPLRSAAAPSAAAGGLSFGGGSLSHTSASGAALSMIGGSLSRATALVAPGAGGQGRGVFTIGIGGLVAAPATARALEALQAGSRAGLSSLLQAQGSSAPPQ